MVYLLRCLCWFASVLPLSWAMAWGRSLGFLYGSAIRYHRADAIEALTRVFPEKSDREIQGIVRRMYANLGMNMVEFLRMGGMTERQIRETIDIEGEEYLKQVMEGGRGALGLTGHLGNWEMICAVAPRLGYQASTVAKTIKNAAINDYVTASRKQFGLHILPPRNSFRACLRALKQGHVLTFILDQNMISREGVFVDFFGRPACTTPGLALLSAHTGLPVVPIFPLRLPGGRHIVRCLPPIPPPTDRSPESIQRATQVYTQALEDVIRQQPDQWIWIHRRWRTVPDPCANHVDTDPSLV